MKIQHHPDDSTLMSYAGGGLHPALAAVVASHVSLCPHCQREMKLMARIGLACVRELPDADIRMSAPVARLHAREQDPAEPSVSAAGSAPKSGDVPAPIRRFVGERLDAIDWKKTAPGLWSRRLPLPEGQSGDLRLLRVAAGRAMPEHGHGGTELTLILKGAYQDRFGRFAPGDIADHDDSVEHKPIVEADHDCICLVASERPARFKGLIVRAFQPLTGL